MLSDHALFRMTLVSTLAACSVINSFDEVKPAIGGKGGSGGTLQGSGGSQSGTAGSMTSGGSIGGNRPGGGSVGTGGGPPSMGGAPGTGAGGEAGEGIAPVNRGLLVVGGTSLDGDNVLVAIDPETGEELLRETLQGASVVGLAQDGASRDAWFIFTATEFPAAPHSKADLQVRRFQDAQRLWSPAARLTALPSPRPYSFVVLNERLAYLSYEVVNNAVVDSLTLLDTSSLTAVRRIAFSPPAFGGELIGLAGTRGAPGDPSAPGGTLVLVVGVGCAGVGVARSCTSMNLIPVFVGSDEVSSGVAAVLPAFGGRPAFASAQLEQIAFAAVAQPAVTQSLRLFRFDPRMANDGTVTPIASRARWIGGLVSAECQTLALMTSVNDQRLLTVTPQGLTVETPLGHSGQSLAYDPFTQRVFASFNAEHAVFGPSGADGAGGAGDGGAGGGTAGPEGAALSAFNATRSSTSASVVPAPGFESPVDLAPNVMAARFPVPFECP